MLFQEVRLHYVMRCDDDRVDPHSGTLCLSLLGKGQWIVKAVSFAVWLKNQLWKVFLISETPIEGIVSLCRWRCWIPHRQVTSLATNQLADRGTS